jgi:hypothetical protein
MSDATSSLFTGAHLILHRRLPPGGGRTAIFGDTLPEVGESGATSFAEVDEDGRARRLIVRADAF